MIVEDGTGKVDANSYASTDYADNYWDTELNNTWLRQSDDAKETALIQAAKEIDKKFVKRFVGTKKFRDQALCWPRINAIDTDGFLWDNIVPTSVKNASCEIAMQIILGLNVRDTESTTETIKSKSVKIGEITIATTYESPLYEQNVMSTVDDLLASLVFLGGGISVKAYRV